MSILAIDIGGTYTRFGHFPETSESIHPEATFRTLTQTETIKSISDLLEVYLAEKPDPFLKPDEYDAIALSVPGPVLNNECLPPNISWSIQSRAFKTNKPVIMLNDFAAQAYACLLNEVQSSFQAVHTGQADEEGAIAIIGAGTGLGHCTLVPDKNVSSRSYNVLSSEAGHSNFSFIGDEEKAFEVFLKDKLKIDFCVSDNVVNGRGISYLHEFLTDKRMDADMIFSSAEKFKMTIEWFTRFYARVARNYCLSNMISNKLIISGGLAAKNPWLVRSDVFREEFTHITSESYLPLLKNLPIYLNKNDDLGLIGVHHYAKTHI